VIELQNHSSILVKVEIITRSSDVLLEVVFFAAIGASVGKALRVCFDDQLKALEDSVDASIRRSFASDSARLSHAGSRYMQKVQATFREGFHIDEPREFGAYDDIPSAAVDLARRFHITSIRKKGVSPLPTIRKWLWDEYYRIEIEEPQLLRSRDKR
jgi:hypothetical protein